MIPSSEDPTMHDGFDRNTFLPNSAQLEQSGRVSPGTPTIPIALDDGPTELDTVHRRIGSIRLYIESGPEAGREIELTPCDGDDQGEPHYGNRIIGGRSKYNQIVIPDAKVSASHFALRLEKGSVRLQDLDSSNGTFIGPVRVSEAWLVPGTTFSPAGRCNIRLVDATEAEVRIHGETQLGPLFGASPVMREIFLAIKKLARTPLSVLIEGETGTGKELVARAIHDHSRRAQQEFKVFDCTHLPRDLAESMLCGSCKGAFTDATDQPGIFEHADGGTLFIDEIGELPLELQPKLLRMLEYGEVQRLGERTARKFDVRFIAATHRDLRAMVADGKFREDLYYRIAQSSIRLPSLRERGDVDVLGLAQRFLDEECRTQGDKRISISEEAKRWLKREQWPGNVRQLRNVMRRVAYVDTHVVDVRDLAEHWKKSHCREPNPWLDLKLDDATLCFRNHYIRNLLQQTGGNLTEAGRRSDYSRTQLSNILNAYKQRFPTGEPTRAD
jgi:DNA-binding NtrC family response regulator